MEVFRPWTLHFFRCDQRSEVAADYDSIRLEKNPGWMDVWMDVCVCVCVYEWSDIGWIFSTVSSSRELKLGVDLRVETPFSVEVLV